MNLTISSLLFEVLLLKHRDLGMRATLLDDPPLGIADDVYDACGILTNELFTSLTSTVNKPSSAVMRVSQSKTAKTLCSGIVFRVLITKNFLKFDL